MPLASVDLLARVVAPTVFADSVGALDRLGVHDPRAGHRVPAIGVAQRRVQRIVDPVSVTPASFQILKYQYTVSHGGKSCGSCRHEHNPIQPQCGRPPRSFTIARSAPKCSAISFERPSRSILQSSVSSSSRPAESAHLPVDPHTIGIEATYGRLAWQHRHITNHVEDRPLLHQRENRPHAADVAVCQRFQW